MPRPPRAQLLFVACCCATGWAVLGAQQGERLPTAHLVPGPRLVLPGDIDSNIPMHWDLMNGTWTLSAMASWGGIPALLTGPSLDRMQRIDGVSMTSHPGHGVWIESIIGDDGGTWYGYYHHETSGEVCNRPQQSIVRIGAARSIDRGITWENLGIILEGAPGDIACATNNRFVLGGVGDLSAILDPAQQDLFLFVSQYSREPSAQGVAVARLAWADRDAPQGRVMVWQDGVWAAPHPMEDPDGNTLIWSYQTGTPLVPASRPWHDGNAAADVFWGPSVHWNTYLERYVMLLNRAKDEEFRNEGLYVSFARSLADPRAWSAPRKIMDGGSWYPQVAGLEPGGTDKLAGQRARFFITGRSEAFIEFRR